MAGTNVVPDGNAEIAAEVPLVVEIIARTCRWVHPETFRRLPVWCPWTARGRPLYDRAWQRRYTNTKRATRQAVEKVEGNVAAIQTLVAALGVARPRPRNWTICHVWGYDDPAFASQGSIVQDPRFFSCVANMVWLPTPLKGFTDALPEVKTMLRTCAFHLYGWACEHESSGTRRRPSAPAPSRQVTRRVGRPRIGRASFHPERRRSRRPSRRRSASGRRV
jgi:hypothetical protein